VISFTLLLLCAYSFAHAQLSLDVEGNYIFSIPYNEVRIPAVGGTMIDIAKDLEPEETFTFRLRANYLLGDRHVISALYAPLSINSSGEFNQTVNYSNKNFAAGSDIRATYKFNSYRLTYRYLVVNKEKVKFGIGLTGKIREANITLKNNDTAADYPDLGFVPLINFYFDFQPIDRLSILLEGDALASKQGRAEDIFAGITYLLSENIKGKIGYRVLEGGADVERNYNFAWINYAAIGVVIDLGGR
jgi:hypothetical protein